jgi:G3E family GTPase
VSHINLDEEVDSRLRLSVLGGYLGAGKTTWLRHQLHEGVFRDAFVIVNEAAETPVDDALLQNAPRLAVLAGGCACCSGKAELISCLRGLIEERSKMLPEQARLQRIVLETSGLADPGPIVEAIRTDPVLVHHIVVSEVLVAVDALHALAQLQVEPLGRRQIESADCFMITKLMRAI